ncbi:hypothetical protein DDI_2131 [Dickeya dianthicola RNS04.9]|nr:hypothetical protein DDI_2131 [Dickeya dianthicola RNS04.9]
MGLPLRIFVLSLYFLFFNALFPFEQADFVLHKASERIAACFFYSFTH